MSNFVYVLDHSDGVNLIALEFINAVLDRPTRIDDVSKMESYWVSLIDKNANGLLEDGTYDYYMYTAIKEQLGDKPLSYLYSMEGILQQVQNFTMRFGNVFFLYPLEDMTVEDDELYSVIMFSLGAKSISKKLYERLVIIATEMSEGKRHAVEHKMDDTVRDIYNTKKVLQRPNRQPTPDKETMLAKCRVAEKIIASGYER